MILSEELASIQNELANLEKIVKLARKRKAQIYYTRYPRLKRDFLETLLKLKEHLIKLKLNAHDEQIAERVEDFLYIVNELLTSKERIRLDAIEENIMEMKNVFAELRALGSLPQFGLNLDRIPSEIRAEIAEDVGEVVKCYSVGAYRAAIVFCGRIIEVALARKYYESTGIDPIEKKWTLGQLLNECRKKLELPPALDDACKMVNKVRVYSVHKKKGVYLMGPHDVLAAFYFVQSIVEKLW
jgi:hypothetical protein